MNLSLYFCVQQELAVIVHIPLFNLLSAALSSVLSSTLTVTIQTECSCFDHLATAAAETRWAEAACFVLTSGTDWLRVFPGCTTTSVCRHPCLRCLLWDPAWLNDPALPPTPPGTDGAETKLTPKAPELTPRAHLQPSVSNMHGLNPRKHSKCLVPNNCTASLLPCCRWRLNALRHLTF